MHYQEAIDTLKRQEILRVSNCLRRKRRYSEKKKRKRDRKLKRRVREVRLAKNVNLYACAPCAECIFVRPVIYGLRILGCCA